MAQARRLPQYIAAVGATLGGFALGTVIGWSSPAIEIISTNYPFTTGEISWISSIMAIGAASAQLYMAIVLDFLGRKISMLVTAIPFIVGWVLIAFADTVEMFCVGRFITGFCGGSFCVAAPAYIGEMADKGVRGTLGVFFQLLLVIGILLAYVLGEAKDLNVLTLPLVAGPVLLFIILLFLPESPVHLCKKGKIEQAQKALRFFRGPNYDISGEMKEIQEYTKVPAESVWKHFKSRACLKAFLMLLIMHTVQQLSGINVVMFYAHNIFEMAGSTLSAGSCSIILAVVQVVMTTVSAYLVDRVGRRLLWIVSLAIMGTCLFFLGIFFMVKRTNEETANSLAWVPLFVICLYLTGFSLGAGPLPFVMLGELLPNTVKGYLGPFVIFFNWMLTFVITRTFTIMVDAMGADVVFWLYASACGLGFIFMMMCLIETKSKTLEQIQLELEES